MPPISRQFVPSSTPVNLLPGRGLGCRRRRQGDPARIQISLLRQRPTGVNIARNSSFPGGTTPSAHPTHEASPTYLRTDHSDRMPIQHFSGGNVFRPSKARRTQPLEYLATAGSCLTCYAILLASRSRAMMPVFRSSSSFVLCSNSTRWWITYPTYTSPAVRGNRCMCRWGIVLPWIS